MENTVSVAGNGSRWLAAVALVTAAALVGGCGTDTSTTGSVFDAPSASPAAPGPQDVLLAAVPDGDEGAFRFTVDDDEVSGAGVVDPASKGLEIALAIQNPDLGFTMNMAFLVVDQKSWVKITYSDAEDLVGLPELPEKWLLIDPAKVDDAEGRPLTYDDPDPANTAGLCRAIVAAEETGSGRYEGTLDLTQATAAEVVDADTLTALGDAAQAVPFTADVDANGRLASMTIQVPSTDAEEAYEYEITYTDYGSAPQLTAPSAADSQDAPAVAYEILNS